MVSPMDEEIIKAVVDRFREWEEDPKAKEWSETLNEFLKEKGYDEHLD